jgi:hypothetical protein
MCLRAVVFKPNLENLNPKDTQKDNFINYARNTNQRREKRSQKFSDDKLKKNFTTFNF